MAGYPIPTGYRRVQTLGEGATSVVYEALRDGTSVAIKVLRPELHADGQARMRFHREARALQEIRHDNVVRVLDYSGEDAELIYIATEKLQGIDLSRVGRAMPLAAAASAFAQAARGLHAAHTRGLVHRDLSLNNIFAERSGRAVVTDFGLVAAVIGARTRETFITRAASVIGSPLYLAPEVLQAQHYDVRTDLYALGVALSFALLGHSPGADDIAELLGQILEGKLEKPEGPLRPLIDLLTGARAQRPQSAEWVADQLEQFADAKAVAALFARTATASTLKLRF